MGAITWLSKFTLQTIQATSLQRVVRVEIMM
jgi:hypothetical protein